jgi:hypothetical protein
MSKQRDVDPIPEDLDSYEKAAEFWDAHDTTDYPDAFRTVEEGSQRALESLILAQGYTGQRL